MQVDRHYIDFIVSGKSLGALVDISTTDLIGTFGWTDNLEYEGIRIKEFSGFVPPELESGRTTYLNAMNQLPKKTSMRAIRKMGR